MKTRTAAALVAAVTIAIYWRALHAGFVGDDVMILHRLRSLSGPWPVLRLFRGEFFEYYRPLGFVAHAIDWSLAGANPWQFHLTNLLLHTANAILVLLIGRALSPRSMAGPVAALLFALHASNHEAVVWISARFDLLAALFSLGAVYWMQRRGRAFESFAGSFDAFLFLCALLSKEAAVALPIAAAAFEVFIRRSSTTAAAKRVLPWLLALAVYSLLRHLAGGVSPIAGAARIPKLVAFILILGAVLLLGDGRWLRVRAWLRERRAPAIAVVAACVAATGIAAGWTGGHVGRLAADKLAFAGFALFHLGSPVLDSFDMPFYLQPDTSMYWLGGVIAVAAAGVLVALLWRPLVDDDRIWFLAAFLIAALLPISALTEGARYLYLPSAALSLVAGIVITELRGRPHVVAIAAVLGILAISAGQIVLKVRDWNWAGRLTSDGAHLVDASLAPGCEAGHVVFLTEPVGIRAVYTQFYYETFELPRGCIPAEFDILTRVVRVDASVEPRWDGVSRIVMTVPAYRDNFVASKDLRHFDVPIRGTQPVSVTTPLGTLTAERIGADERLTLSLGPVIRPDRIHFFYYSDGQIRALPPAK